MTDVAGPGPSSPFQWFPEFLDFGRARMRAQGRLLAASILVGVVAGAGGIVFSMAGQAVAQWTLEGIAGYRAEGPAAEVRFPWIPGSVASFHPLMLIILPTIGGLLSGLIVARFAPEAEGHGTDAAIEAYHRRGGYIRPRVPLVKLISSALTIGTGGSGGREGPIAQIGAGFGSVLGGLLKFRPEQTRILLAAGMGAGVSAIFRSPLAGALFAAEILYSSPEFEPEVILPAGLACVVSYCTFGVLAFWLGGTERPWSPLFATPDDLAFASAWELVPYTALAVLMAVMSMIYVRTFYGTHHLFKKLRVKKALRPAIGAAMAGAVGVALYYLMGRRTPVLAVLSYGYGILQEGLRDESGLSALVLLTIALGKIVTTSLTIGSGGSGGVFGPSMVIGGCAGGSFGLFVHGVCPAAAPHPASFVILGMAGFFAAAAKTPFSTLIIVSEMTGDYRLLLPALWVCSLAFLVSDREPLYQSQVEGRSLSPAHRGEFVRQALAGARVRQVFGSGGLFSLRPDDSLLSVTAAFDRDPSPVLPVSDADGRLLGVVALDELRLALRAEGAGAKLVAADLMRADVTPLRPDDPIEVGMQLFVENDLLALPVVDGPGAGKLVGMVRRSDLARAYLNRLQGE